MTQNHFQKLTKIAREWEKIYIYFLNSSVFRDINLARECETECGSKMFECLEECGASTECSSSCHRENVVCIDACPCHTGKSCHI